MTLLFTTPTDRHPEPHGGTYTTAQALSTGTQKTTNERGCANAAPLEDGGVPHPGNGRLLAALHGRAQRQILHICTAGPWNEEVGVFAREISRINH